MKLLILSVVYFVKVINQREVIEILQKERNVHDVRGLFFLKKVRNVMCLHRTCIIN